jgi:hypothetical protein
MNYFCCTDTRRNAVKLHPVLNGIDFLEVLDNLSDPYNERQRTLFVHFLKPLSPGTLDVNNIVIEGGERIRNIKVIEVGFDIEGSFPASPPFPEGTEVLMVKVSAAGDYSTYTLRLIRDHIDDTPPLGFDPVLSSVDFSFKVSCPTDFDCQPVMNCQPGYTAPPEINYLAKDYDSFRQLMLDRMSLLMPSWKERNPADMGIALVELLAYTGDYLSYRQDAIATEAYLDTSRKRISVRRHARLVDYFMHDGCNARAWVHLQVGDNVNGLLLQKGSGDNTTKILARREELSTALHLDSKEYSDAIDDGAQVFELMHDIRLYTSHNEMHFYTWGGKECCLPKGATSATLLGNLSTLNPGDVLIFSEVLGPVTGVPEDADPTHRQAVRLTRVKLSSDILYEGTGSPVDDMSFPVTEITWDSEDALLFPFCISVKNGTTNISVAFGNNVLADHGLTIADGVSSSLLPSIVPVSAMQYANAGGPSGCDCCDTTETEAVAARFFPKLLNAPLTNTAPFDFNDKTSSAVSFMKWQMRDTMPAIVLTELAKPGDIRGNHQWVPRRDLLNSAANAKEFVVETEFDGTAYMRFGNDMQGERPVAGSGFIGTYRIGNGVSGNIGSGALAHLATNDAAVIAVFAAGAAVWNPLPAIGGMEPESMEEVKQQAPNAFRKQERAVIPADYDEFAKKTDATIQQTATTFRWTGSWRTVFLTVDRLGGFEVDNSFEKGLRNGMERYRMAGFDLEADSPLFVSLELEMSVCVNTDFFTSDVKAALLEVFSNRLLAGGQKGLFHPDNFSFGQPVYLSRLYSAAQSVQGVDSVKITKLMRQGDTNNDALNTGKFLLGRREIARLDNDRNFPEHGVFNLIMKGGR